MPAISLFSCHRLHRCLTALLLLTGMFFAIPASAATNCSAVMQIPQAECEALLDLYHSTDGLNWTDNDGWNTDNEPCGWRGVSCQYSNHVDTLFLQRNQLKGSIPESIANLESLERLYLFDNQLNGNIPEVLGNLSKLRILALWNNQLSGLIPEPLGDLPLTDLDLHNNQLTGNIPESLGNIDSLEKLILNDNQLSGSIPETVGNLANLGWLYLHNNQLTGTIPQSLENLSELRFLNLSANQLGGSIPEFSGNLLLKDLDLHNNRLTGSIPESLGNIDSLRILTLNNNQLSGSIPETLGNLKHHFHGLGLNNNQLTGVIPETLGNLRLAYLDLGNNMLSGSIPEELREINSLNYLNLSNNQLTGFIPKSLRNLEYLNILSLNCNQLTGSIPEELGEISSLAYLNLAENHLGDNIPESLGNLNNLWGLMLGGNQLTGNIPVTLGNLHELRILRIDDNKLTGLIPAELSNLAQLGDISPVNTWYINLERPGDWSDIYPRAGISLTDVINLINITDITLNALNNLGLGLQNNNCLSTQDPALLAFLEEENPEWTTQQCSPPTELPPVAMFSLVQADVPDALIVAVNAANSTDPDGQIVDFRWATSDGQIATGDSAEFNFDEASEYQVTLTVTDDGGLTNLLTQVIVVHFPISPPVADFSFKPAGYSEAPVTVTLDASHSVDWDGEIVEYQWLISDARHTTGEVAELDFTEPGEYEVTLAVVDDVGLTGTLTKTLTIERQQIPPIADFEVISISPDAPFYVEIDASSSSDPDGGEIIDYSWDQIAGATIIGNYTEDLALISTTFIFGEPGDYELTLTVVDDYGYSGTTSKIVSVFPQAEPEPHAGLELDSGMLTLPAVDIGLLEMFDAELVLIDPVNLIFELIALETTDTEMESPSTFDTGTWVLTIPRVQVGEIWFLVEMQMIVDDTTITFAVINATPVN